MGAKFIARLCFFVFFGLTLSTSYSEDGAQRTFADGYELLKQGKFKEAAEKFERGLITEPGNSLAHYYLGETYLEIGDSEQARKHFRTSLELEPKSKVFRTTCRKLQALSPNGIEGGPIENCEHRAPGTVFRDCASCPELVVVPPGKFIMGSPPTEAGREDTEGPERVVTIKDPFAMGRYEVTFDEWDACAADKRCAYASGGSEGRGRRPVMNINLDQAKGYVEWLSIKAGRKYVIPSESLWEYAARAGSELPRFWGTSPDLACEFANVADFRTNLWPETRKLMGQAEHRCDDKFHNAAPVGSFQPNAFGLYDMLGNVSEWVQDCYVFGYVGAPAEDSIKITNPCTEGVLRGGSWVDGPNRVRSAARKSQFRLGMRANYDASYYTQRVGQFIGFRVARRLP